MNKKVAALAACAWIGGAWSLSAQTAGIPVTDELPYGQVFLVDGREETVVAGDGEATARGHLARNGERYGLPSDPADLRLESTRESLLGRHFYYRQYAEGVPVLSAGVTVSVGHTNRAVYRVYSTARPTEGRPRTGRANIDSEAALDRAWDHGVRHQDSGDGQQRGRHGT